MCGEAAGAWQPGYETGLTLEFLVENFCCSWVRSGDLAILLDALATIPMAVETALKPLSPRDEALATSGIPWKPRFQLHIATALTQHHHPGTACGRPRSFHTFVITPDFSLRNPKVTQLRKIRIQESHLRPHSPCRFYSLALKERNSAM